MKKTSEFKNLKLFIEWLKTKNNVKEIIDEFETQQDKGYVFERLFDLVIKFGYCGVFAPNNNFKHIISNVNNGIIDYMVNLQTYLTDNGVSNGNSGGSSDITLYDIENNQYIFISSKYPKSNEDIKKQKSVGYYDIQNIIAMGVKNKHIYSNYKIYLVVPNKKKVLEKVKNANKSSEYITEHMTGENILDEEDLNKYFLELKKDLLKYKFDDYNNIYMKKKDKLITRFHQKLINQKTSELITDGEKQILWACKCRSGKTFMAGGQIIDLFSNREKVNNLIITPAPTETLPQFTDDLFNSYLDFDEFKIHSITSGKILKSLEIEEKSSNIFVASKQLLQDYTKENKNKNIKNIDIIFFDENHFSGTTELSKNIIETYSSKKTVKIYLTATYNKPLKEWGIPENCQMYWDIEDEQICKSICNDEKEISKLVEKHGSIVNEIIEGYKLDGYSIKDIFKSYLSMPDLYLLSSLFDPDRYDAIKEKISDSQYGFSFETLLSLNSSKTKFKFENEVITFFRYISGSNKEQDFKKKDKSIISRINKICSEKKSRLPFTQIWFLPPNNINETSKALIKVLEKDSVLSQYDFYCINSKNSDIDASKIKQMIENYELKAKEENKKGLILLAGNMLSLGITLSNCDVVMLLNNTLSSDKVMQQMYRCMTEGKDKKFGFVVDLNISRVLNTCINYSIYKKDLNTEEKLKYMFDYHLMNIDVDMWENKKLDSDYLINKLLDIWKNDPINNLRIMLKNLDNEYLEFDNDTQKLLNKSFTSSANDKLTSTIEFKDKNDESQSIKSGKETIETDNSDNKELNDMDKDLLEEEKKEKEISFTKDVLPFVIPLTCILTMSDTNKDFVKMLYDIQKNKELLEVFDEQSLIWWNKKDLINIISNIVEKFINKNSNTFNISINFKMGLKSLIDKPKELLELINECLKPKEIEKNKFGEVFTPINLINEKLNVLDYYYKKKNNNISIFTNKTLKWFDPSNGMGNYSIAIYLRLIDGLKDVIIDEKKRKKHILEKMLYMSEINKKNCYTVRQIFNINNEYKLNLYEGDTLKMDVNKIFNINGFDIIVGNPPYNNELWSKFVQYSIDNLNNDGYLLFIHPPNWRKPEHKIGKIMLSYDIHELRIYDIKNTNKIFTCNVRVDWYLLQKSKTINLNTKIIDEEKINYNLNIKNKEFIPNSNINLIYKILNNECQKLNIIRSHEIISTNKNLKTKETDKYKYKIITNLNGKETKIKLLDTHHSKHFDKKVIMSYSLNLYPFYDKGDISPTEHVFYQIVDSDIHGLNLVNYLNTDILNLIIKSCKWIGYQTDHKIFKYIPNFSIVIKNINDDKIFKYLNLTNDEIKLINNIKNINNDKKTIKRSISKKIEKDINSDSDEEKKPKITKVKKNKSTVNKKTT